LLKDSKPTGVTDRKALETAARPFDRFVGSNEPRTSISLAENVGYGVSVFLLG